MAVGSLYLTKMHVNVLGQVSLWLCHSFPFYPAYEHKLCSANGEASASLFQELPKQITRQTEPTRAHQNHTGQVILSPAAISWQLKET